MENTVSADMRVDVMLRVNGSARRLRLDSRVTLLDALRFIVWHEGLHLGQVSLLRSHHGLTPLVTLVFERAAAV